MRGQPLKSKDQIFTKMGKRSDDQKRVLYYIGILLIIMHKFYIANNLIKIFDIFNIKLIVC